MGAPWELNWAAPETAQEDGPWNKNWAVPEATKPSEPRGALSEVGVAALRGFLAKLPEMVGSAAQFIGQSPGPEPTDRGSTTYEIGTSLRNVAKDYEAKPWLEARPEGHGLINSAFTQGAEMIGPSVASMGTMLIPGMQGPAGLTIASALGASIFGASQAQETYENGKQAGLTDTDANAAAWKSGAIEAGGEFVGTMALGWLFGAVGKVAGKTIGSPVDAVFSAYKNPEVLKEFAKKLPATYATEIATEMGQNAGERAVEQNAGIPGETPWETAKQAIGPTAAMTTLLTPFGLVGHNRAGKFQSFLADTAEGANNDPKYRNLAVEQITTSLKEVDPEFAAKWSDYAKSQIAAGQPVELSPAAVSQPAPPADPVAETLAPAAPILAATGPDIASATDAAIQAAVATTNEPSSAISEAVDRASAEVQQGLIARSSSQNVPNMGTNIPNSGTTGEPNAAEIQGARTLDVGEQPQNGEAMGGGNAQPQETTGTGEGQGPDRLNNPQEVISSATDALKPQPENLPILQQIPKKQTTMEEGAAMVAKGYASEKEDGTFKLTWSGIKARAYLQRKVKNEQAGNDRSAVGDGLVEGKIGDGAPSSDVGGIAGQPANRVPTNENRPSGPGYTATSDGRNPQANTGIVVPETVGLSDGNASNIVLSAEAKDRNKNDSGKSPIGGGVGVEHQTIHQKESDSAEVRRAKIERANNTFEVSGLTPTPQDQAAPSSAIAPAPVSRAQPAAEAPKTAQPAIPAQPTTNAAERARQAYNDYLKAILPTGQKPQYGLGYFLAQEKAKDKGTAPAPATEKKIVPTIAEPVGAVPQLPDTIKRRKFRWNDARTEKIESVEAGEDGLRIATPETGKVLWTTESDTGLQPVEIVGKGSNFDQYQGWKFKWLDGPEKGKVIDAYGRGFYEPEPTAEPPKPAPAPAIDAVEARRILRLIESRSQADLNRAAVKFGLGSVETGADTINRRLREAAQKVIDAESSPASAPVSQGGFDSEAFNKKRADAIKASRASGAIHLDQVPAGVESMRGREIFYAHDPKQRGVIRTVDNRGNVYVNWSDEYSAGKELASESVEDNKNWLKSSKALPYMRVERDGKTYVMQSSLGPSDLKDYAFADSVKPAHPDLSKAPSKFPAPATQAEAAKEAAKAPETEKPAATSVREKYLDEARRSNTRFEGALKSWSGADVAESEYYRLEARFWRDIAEGKLFDDAFGMLNAQWQDYAKEQSEKVAKAPKIGRGPSQGQSVIGHRWVSAEFAEDKKSHLRFMVDKIAENARAENLTAPEQAIVAEVVADAETQVDPVAFEANTEAELDKVLGAESRETETKDESVAVPAVEGTTETGAPGGETAVAGEHVAAAAEQGPAKPAAVGDRIRFTPANMKLGMVVEGEVIAADKGQSGQTRYTVRTDQDAPQGGGKLERTVWSNNGTVEVTQAKTVDLDAAFREGVKNAEERDHKVNFEKPDYADLLQTYHQILRALLGRDSNIPSGGVAQFFAIGGQETFQGSLTVENLRKNFNRYVEWMTGEVEKASAGLPDRYYGGETPHERNAIKLDKAAKEMRRTHEETIEAAEVMNPGSPEVEKLKTAVESKAQEWETQAIAARLQLKQEQDDALAAEVASYVPFDAAQVEKPSMNEMGFNKGAAAAKANLGWMIAKVNGKEVYTDGHILDFSEPQYKTWRNYLGVRNDSAKAANKGKGMDASKVVPFDAKRQIKPVAISTAETKNRIKFVLFDDGQGDFATFDRRFVNYFLSKYPKATFYQKGYKPDVPALVKNGKDVVGVMMPIRWGTDHMGVEEALRERFLGEKTETPTAEPETKFVYGLDRNGKINRFALDDSVLYQLAEREGWKVFNTKGEAEARANEQAAAKAPNPIAAAADAIIKAGEALKASVSAPATPAQESAPNRSGTTRAEAKPNVGTSKQEPTGIQDFGLRIAGARKDYAAKLQEAKSADIAAVPLSQSWPEPDYQKLLDGGADQWAVAFMHAARDEVPSKPSQSWKLQRWVAQVEQLRDVSLGLAEGKHSVERAKELLAASKALAPVATRLELYQEVGHAKSLKGIRISKGVYSLYNKVEYNPPKVIWSVESKGANTAMSRWPKMLATGDTREEAIANFKKAWLETTPEQDVSKAIDFQIYAGRDEAGKRTIYIGKKIGSNVVKLKVGFTDVSAARAWKTAHQAELVSMLDKYKDVPYERKETNSPRVGIDHRNGADVTPERFTEAFGFRGVQFGNYIEGGLRQQDLNEAYDALADLAGVLGIPTKALSLNGGLGLAFGARGTGGKRAPAAHYEPDQVVINLTKAKGAGSLAHEWFHGVDNYFAGLGGQPGQFVTEHAEMIGADGYIKREGRKVPAFQGVRPEMAAAFEKVMQTIRTTSLPARSRRLDETRSKPYWGTKLEMAARSFESYIVAKLQDQNASNDYLANIVSEDYWKAATALGIEKDNTFPYPTTAEMTPIRAAFDHFFQTVETRETDKGTALFAKSESAPAGITVSTLRAEIAKAFGPKATALVGDILIPLETQAEIESVSELADVVPLIREGDRISGFYHPATGKTYAILENLAPEGVRGLVLHEVGVHYGFQGMLGDAKYAQVVRQLDAMRRAGNKAVIEAHEQATQQAAKPSQVPEETLAYLVTNRIELPFVKRLIAQIKSFLFSKFGILGDKLTVDDIAALARASVLHASEGVRKGEPQFMVAWHGSPHDFDEFSLHNIGTGEGAQAYGWGAYFASNKAVAEHYRNALTGGANAELNMLSATKDGKTLNGWNLLPEYFKPGSIVRSYAGWDKVISFNGDPLGQWDVTVQEVKDQTGNPPRSPFDRPRTHGTSPSSKEVMTALEKDGWQFQKPGKLYQVDLAPKEDEYLDWDKPLSEQSESVRKAIAGANLPEGLRAELAKEAPTSVPAHLKSEWAQLRSKGAAFYGLLAQSLADQTQKDDGWRSFVNTINDRVSNYEAASKYLLSIGIPGIRYLDGSSRGKGAGNSNYVIFDDKHISIAAKFSRSQDQTQTEALGAGIRFSRNTGQGGLLNQESPNETMDPPADEVALVQNAVEGKTLHDAARFLMVNGDEVQKLIAGRILMQLNRLDAAGVKLTLNVVHVGDIVPSTLIGARGLTKWNLEKDNNNIEVWLNGADVVGKVGTSKETLLHELIHSVTAAIVTLGNRKDAVGYRTAQDVKELYVVTNHVIKHFNQRVADSKEGKIQLTAFEDRMYQRENNAFENVHETLSWGLSNVDAQAYLETIPYPAHESAWTAFVNAIRKLLHIPEKAATAFSELLRVSENLMSENVNEILGIERADGQNTSIQSAVNSGILLQRNAVQGVTGGNVGTFDQNNPDIRFSQPIDVAKERLNKITDFLIYNFQDRFMDLRRIQERAGEVPENMDASLAEERYSSKVAAKVQDFTDDSVKPLLKAIHDAKLEYEEVEDFLHALHAPSRNAAMQAINPTAEELDAKRNDLTETRDRLADDTEVREFVEKRRELRQVQADVEDGIADDSAVGVVESEIASLRQNDNVREYSRAVDELRALKNAKPFNGDNTALSGMSDKKAADIIAKAKAEGKLDAMEAISRRIDAITASTRKIYVDGGLETQATIDAWESKYEHYVPLHVDEVGEYGMPATGRGFNVRGRESKRATGSDKERTNILAHVVAQHEAAIIRAEKGVVDKALFEFAGAHPDESLWSLDTAPTLRTIDAVTGLAVNRVDPLYKQKPNVLTLKIDGEEHTITFNDKNPETARLAVSMKNLSASDLGEVTRIVGQFTRLLATMNTSANPVFLVRNFLRDAQTAFVNLSDTELAERKKAVFKGIPAAIKGFLDMTTGKMGSEYAKYAREFRDAGGQIGWMEHYKDIGARAETLKNQIETMGSGKLNWTKREAAKYWNLIEQANAAVENGVRLSAYVEARKAGMSEGRAASLSKNLTVNFNRRGAKGVELNMWYMFMNASIQGTARTIKAIGNKNVQKILGYTIASGFMLALLAQSMAGDDDKDGENDYDQLPEYVKANNWVFWAGNRPITIPMPYGYNFFSSIGRKMAEAMFRKNYSPITAAADLAKIFIDAFNPMNQSGSFLQLAAPTIADPFVQWAENRNFAGNPLRKEQFPFGPPKPEFQMGFKSTSAPAKWLTEILNSATGGNDIRPGAFNLNPGAVDFAVTSIAGGAGRTYLQLLSLPMKLLTGEEVEAREIPFANIFASAKPEYQIQRKFFENLRQVELAEGELKRYRSDPAMIAKLREEHAADLRLIGMAKVTSTVLRKLSEQEKAVEKTKADNWREQEKKIEERKTAWMSRFNKRYIETRP